MKILRTAAQAQAAKMREDEAYKEMLVCPECGRRMKALDIGLPLELVPSRRKVFVATCPDCQCRWQSEEF